ncbi:cell division protein ZapA [Trichococcus shcherbakoviae]|uniref:Cell division protein ZapA n=1 Tax=Trichococcus shcherbakoviae subsp. psychrophilus TaxID=2585775 RepID=A0A5C5E6N8_9LACT|nr:cell division protein ZapA [Trichococcus shcherbakoviae]TNV68867.1 cell division protein ZapA [Trichococcus shcherbakoviae subsp. psychrophilus]
MTENKRRFKTIIAGKTYTIVGNKAPEHLTAVSELVNAQLEQIKQAAPALGREERGILVAVNAISDQITKQLEMEELLLKVAELEKALQESQSVTNSASVEETEQAEPEKTLADAPKPEAVADVEQKTEAVPLAEEKAATQTGEPKTKAVETPEKEHNAEKLTGNAPAKKAVANFAGMKRDKESQTVTSMPATISELQQAAREANDLPARKSNSKLTKTTTASEAALKRAQHRTQVRSALGVNRNAENAIPPYTKNQEHDGKK